MLKWSRPSLVAPVVERWSWRQGSTNSSLCAIVVALTIGGSVLLGGQSAWASPGCVALNGTVGPGVGNITGSYNGTGFDAGDVITVRVDVIDSPNIIYLMDATAGGTTLTSPIQNDSDTYVVPAATNHTLTVGFSQSATFQASWTCVSANSSTPSQKLGALQASVTPIVANTSAQAITGAIDRAINDAFSPNGTFFSGGAGGFGVNFAAEPKSQVAKEADKAFGALAYAGDKGMPTKAPVAVMDRAWSLWADVRGTGWRDNDASSGFNGRQLNVTAGLGYKMRPDWLVGVVGGYETFNYDVASLTGTLKGHGGTVGAYTGWKVMPSLRWDAALAWSRVSYDASVTGADGSFTGSRWIASTGLTGSYRWHAFIVEPSAKVFALWEKQGEWTDSTGTVQASRDFSAGRVSTGGKLIYPWLNGSLSVAPYVGFYGDWRFGSNNVSSGAAVVGIENGWSGRVTGGVSIAQTGGGTLTLGGEYGGLGADYKMWSGHARMLWPF